MRAYVVWDSDGYDHEERMSLLVVAVDEERAKSLWREATGLAPLDHGELSVEHAKWEWVDVPEPTLPDHPCMWMPAARTPRGQQYRGYGFRDEDDVRCDSCDDHVDREDATHHGEDAADWWVCRWCGPGADEANDAEEAG